MHEVNALTVDISVSLSHCDGFLIQIHSRYLRRSAQHLGGNGKAAAVAAQVQHRSPLHQGGELEAVVPLVTEKARLVPLGEVHFIGDAVFHNLHQPDGSRGCRHLLRPDTLHAGNASSTCTTWRFVPHRRCSRGSQRSSLCQTARVLTSRLSTSA